MSHKKILGGCDDSGNDESEGFWKCSVENSSSSDRRRPSATLGVVSDKSGAILGQRLRKNNPEGKAEGARTKMAFHFHIVSPASNLALRWASRPVLRHNH